VGGPGDTRQLWGEEATLLGLLPFYHIYGMVCILHGALFMGATVVTLPRFDLEQFLDTMERYRVTVAHLVPPIILALAKHPAAGSRDLSSLGIIFSGAAPLDAELIRACSERVGSLVTQGFGMTETSPVTHCNTSGEPAGAIGTLLPNTECLIADLVTGAALAPGDTGEIVVRGPQVMKGYLNQPEATAAMIDRDGWLHTGDLGYADAGGNFYVVDRLKELIKYKGLQVAPAELEAVLLSHPLVVDAAVIRSPDEEAGEVPKAFVVLKGEVAVEDVLGYVAERVAPYKKIRRVEIVDSIPRSPSGKILRRVLMEREREAVG
ncbi:MAG: AMP-binding protein, partial [Chloroflexi bacterium]|nr:AMP-binding protein [Chloroflexota bacterium]